MRGRRHIIFIVAAALLLLLPPRAWAQGCGASALSCQQLAAQDAAAAGIDPATFVAQIRAESNFNPNALNTGSGAIGIAQFLPSTAANAGFGIAPFDPTDPVAALQAAAAYDAALEVKYGSLTAALTAYSGGLTPANPGAYAPVFADAAAAAAGDPADPGVGVDPATLALADPGAADPAAVPPAGPTDVHDLPGTGAGAGTGVLDQIAQGFQTETAAWQAALFNVAQNLFWLLAGIDLMVSLILLISGGEKVLLSDVAFTIIHWLFPIGLFWWLLQNGSTLATIIVNSLRQAAGLIGGTAITPSTMFWAGINIVTTIWNNSHGFFGAIEAIALMIALVPMAIAFVFAGVWLLLALVEAYIKIGLAALFLAFGGLRWSRNIAVNILQTSLGIGFKLLTMQVIVGLGSGMVIQWAQNSAGLAFQGVFIMLGASIVLATLIKYVPDSVERTVYGYIGTLGDYSHARNLAVGTAAAAAAPVLATAGFTALAIQAFREAAERIAVSGQQGQEINRLTASGMVLGMGQSIASAAGSEIGGRLSGLYRGGGTASLVRMAGGIAQGRRVLQAQQGRPQPPSPSGTTGTP